jgi:hypothetical protein
VLTTEVTHADIDHDGDEDVIMTGVCEVPPWPPSPGLYLSDNNGTGSYSGQTSIGLDGEDPLVGLSVADLDGDGNLDFLAGNPSTSSVLAIRGAGNGSTIRPHITVALPAAPGDLAVADVDADGHLDLVATAVGTGFARVLYGTGTGTFPESHVVATSGDVVGPVAVGDLDGDGSVDLVFGNDGETADSSVAVLFNTRDGRQH